MQYLTYIFFFFSSMHILFSPRSLLQQQSFCQSPFQIVPAAPSISSMSFSFFFFSNHFIYVTSHFSQEHSHWHQLAPYCLSYFSHSNITCFILSHVTHQADFCRGTWTISIVPNNHIHTLRSGPKNTNIQASYILPFMLRGFFLFCTAPKSFSFVHLFSPIPFFFFHWLVSFTYPYFHVSKLFKNFHL